MYLCPHLAFQVLHGGMDQQCLPSGIIIKTKNTIEVKAEDGVWHVLGNPRQLGYFQPRPLEVCLSQNVRHELVEKDAQNGKI